MDDTTSSGTTSTLDYWENDFQYNDSSGKYQLAYVCLYDPCLHGFDPDLTDTNIHGQYICNMTILGDQWRINPRANSSGEEAVESHLDVSIHLGENGSIAAPAVTDEIDGLYISATDQFVPFITEREHPHVRVGNTRAFTTRVTGRLQVVELDYLSGGETICILKTYALRLFQRKCRNFLNRRKQLRTMFGNPNALLNREINGPFRITSF